MKKLLHRAPLFLYASYIRICRYAEGITIIAVLQFCLLALIIFILIFVR